MYVPVEQCAVTSNHERLHTIPSNCYPSPYFVFIYVCFALIVVLDYLAFYNRRPVLVYIALVVCVVLYLLDVRFTCLCGAISAFILVCTLLGLQTPGKLLDIRAITLSHNISIRGPAL